MDKWKLGEDDDEFFKKDDGSNKSFSLGKTDKEDLSDFIFEESKPDSTKKKPHRRKKAKQIPQKIIVNMKETALRAVLKKYFI